MTFGKFLREPLLHFLVIGLGLFLLYGQVSPGDAEGKRIVVSQAQVDDMVRQYTALWGRPPAPAEVKLLTESWVRDEILYREGMASGLGRDDPVIKRRIRQKVEVMAEEENDRAPPSDADLDAYLKAHGTKFLTPAVVSFDQLFFDPATPDSEARFNAAKTALAAGRPAQGQVTMLPGHVEAQDLDLVARDFGGAFAGAVAKLPIGQWSGPVTSGLGVHLVRLTALTPPALPPLAAVRPQVQREWENDRRLRALEASYKKLRGDYDVVIDAKLPTP